MEAAEHEIAVRRKKQLLRLANMTRSCLQANKSRDLFTSEIHALRSEIEHFRDMTTAVRQGLAETIEAIGRLEPKIARCQAQRHDMHADKQALEEEAARLRDFEINFQQKLDTLMDLKQAVAGSRRDVQQALGKFQAVQESCRKAFEQLRQVERATEQDEQKRLPLALEIPMLQSTRDILVGEMPEGFDPEVFQRLRGDLPKNAESYRSEVGGTAGEIELELSRLEEQVAEKGREGQALLFQEQSLQKEIEQLDRFSFMEENKESLIDAIKLAEAQQSRLSAEIAGKQLESRRLEAEIREIEESIADEKQRAQGLLDRLEHLQSRAKELDSIDDLPGVMQSLKEKTARLQLEIKENIDFLGIVTPLKNDAESMNSPLKGAVEDLHRMSDELEHAMRSLAETLER
jgi:chromosome segregation ATPase